MGWYLLAGGAGVAIWLWWRTDSPSARLAHAVEQGRLAHVEALLKAGANPNTRGSFGEPVLIVAAENVAAESVRLLLAHGADPNLASRHRTPLQVAVAQGADRVVEMLLTAGADPHADPPGATLLGHAVRRLDATLVGLLIDHGADVNGADAGGLTPLHLASRTGRLELVQMLLDHDAELNAQDELERTPLDLALVREHTEVARLLESRGGRSVRPERSTAGGRLSNRRCRTCGREFYDAELDGGDLPGIVADDQTELPANEYQFRAFLRGRAGCCPSCVVKN